MARRRQCATMVLHEYLAETQAGYRRNSSGSSARSPARSRAETPRATGKLMSIPVVVHVVYRRDAENISDAQVKSQIAVLNKDFRATNTDKSGVPPVWKSLISDTNIQFARDARPAGQGHDGDHANEDDPGSFPADNSVKKSSAGGKTAWPAKRYLNMWVCNLGDGLLGYAQFPAGLPATDGVVILHSAFGTRGSVKPPFNLGRTATHEVGHWLNLRHIWADTLGCGGLDFVADTPNAAGPNFGKPAFPTITCNNGPNGDMFMNYMDYVDDGAMFMFTNGQSARMNACLIGPRAGLAK